MTLRTFLRSVVAPVRLASVSTSMRMLHTSAVRLAASPSNSAANGSKATATNQEGPASPAPWGAQASDSHANGPEWIANDFSGMSQQPFPREVADILMAPLDPADIEITPDGLLYLPEIKYRRILNRAFGPGGWGLAPRGQIVKQDKVLSREWALLCFGRLTAVARGENTFFKPEDIPTAAEGAKSNALMRCCKDLGIASELWDPRFIRPFKEHHAVQVWTEGTGRDNKGQKKPLWRRTDQPKFVHPWREK